MAIHSNGKKALVIGAGIAGLAMAIRLRALGFEVHVYEANTHTGGKIAELQSKGYRFDAGPSLFTMPHLVEELFWISGKSSKPFEYKKLDEVCRYFYSDGTRFTAPSDKNQLAAVLAETLGEDPEAIRSYLERSQMKFETVGKLFLERSLRKISTFFNNRALQAYLNLPRLGLMQSLHLYNQSLFRNPKTVQLFDRYATYNGSDPYQTPAIMSMIPHLELGTGAYFPENGMYQIARSVEDLAREIGVTFHLGKPVSRILNDSKRGAYGIKHQGEIIESDVVVSAVDVSLTYEKLLGKPELGRRYLNLPRSSSAVIFYWGIRKTFPELGLHNVFFSDDYRAEFKALFKTKTLPEDPTLYLNISCKERSEDAPLNCENWFVMVNAPSNEGQPWHEWVPMLRKTVFQRLSKETNQDLESLIDTEFILDPVSLEARTGSVGGALYGSNSNGRFAAFLRHANYRSAIPHLYFCGGTVHPGGGIPLALQSAAIAAEYVKGNELKIVF